VYLGSTLHTVEVGLGSVSVSTHTFETQPVSDLEVGGEGHVLGNDVTSITGHSEDGGILELVQGHHILLSSGI
jgi:hypothetical protein